MGGITQAWTQVKEQWAKLPPKLRVAATAVAAIGVVVGLVLALRGGGPKQVLFSGLDPRDASDVVATLDGAKIEYELEGGGTIVKVAMTDVDRARIVLAEQDLPKTGNVGFELFEDQSFGLTDFAQRVNYLRALQGELERTISEIDAVSRARVHVTQPEKAVFEDEKVKPTASVSIDMLSGHTLSERNVGAIRHLVASAVEGLTPGEVTVVDTKGNLLGRAGVGDDASATALDYQTGLERDLEARLVRLLERTVGIGGAEVRVSADVDFSRTDTTEEVFDPEQTAVRSESLQEVVEGGGAGAGAVGGVAGAEANGPGAGGAAARRGKGNSRVVRNKNYEVNKTIVHTTGQGATLKRLTVAVLVDGTYTTPEDGSDPVFTPRSAEELAELQAVVESAIGLNPTRGDRIKMASVEFRDRVRPDDLAMAPVDPLMQWIPHAAGGGVLLLIAVVAFVMRRRKKGKNEVVVPEVLQLPTTVEAAEKAIAQAERGDDPNAQPALPEASTGREDILTNAAQDPERTADVIRAWIASDEA